MQAAVAVISGLIANGPTAGQGAVLADALSDSDPATLTVVLLTGLVLLGLISLAAVGAGAVMRRRAHSATAENQRLNALMDGLDEGILVCSGMQVVAANECLCRLLAIPSDAIRDMTISTFMPSADAIDRLLSDKDVTIETVVQTSNGASITVEASARTIDYGGVDRRLVEIRDIRERKRTEERASFLAHHDPLTALPNREVLKQRLQEAITQARASGGRCAVIWIDLDRFKEINDVYGHFVGDRILHSVAEKLRFELPVNTLIARLGGDEFVVLYEELQDAEEARLAGQHLRRLLNRPISLGDFTTTVGASLGVAVFPEDADNGEELLKNADLALYQAKAEGRGKCRHFTDTLAKERARRAALSESLRRAIENGEVQAYFQPLLSARDQTINGFEALGRWHHPEFGPIAPFEFVKLAEENGHIGALTDAMIRQAIAAAQNWPSHVRVSVNVSPVQINSELVDQVREVIRTSGFDPRRLELEVTEDVLIKDFNQTASMFARLRGLGVQLAMDDFGAGYTSLGNLRRLNFDRIKVDRIFTADLPNHRRSAAIVRSLLVLARELELAVTVEGVETAEQFAFLRNEGCDEVQGFYFSPPKPFSAFADLAGLQLGPPVQTEAPAPARAALIDLTDIRKRVV